VTTNFMGFFKPADYRKWAHHEDVVSLDTYPDPSDGFAAAQNAAQCDLTRSLGDGKPWMLMEQTPSAVNWRPRNVLKQPGQMRLWSMQAVARGANTVMFFQWRAAKAGAEKFHGALVPHIGVENSRVWREVSALGNELQELGPLAQSRVVADVGILVDWQSWWALEQDSKPSTAVTFYDRLATFYGPLYAANLTTDFVFTDSDFANYKLLVIPNLYLVDDATAAKIEAYVAAGGTVVIGFFSGIVDANEHIRLGGYPAPFRKLLGLRVEEFAPMAEGESNAVQLCRRHDGGMRPVGGCDRPRRRHGAGDFHWQLLRRAAGDHGAQLRAGARLLHRHTAGCRGDGCAAGAHLPRGGRHVASERAAGRRSGAPSHRRWPRLVVRAQSSPRSGDRNAARHRDRRAARDDGVSGVGARSGGAGALRCGDHSGGLGEGALHPAIFVAFDFAA
jgi:hypothetical protein